MKIDFHKASILSFWITVVFLILSFIVPGNYLRGMTAAVIDEAEQTHDALMQGDAEAALEHMQRLSGEFNSKKDKIKLFFNHQELDEMEQAINSSLDLVKMGQGDNLICELNRIISIAKHMETVENWDLSNIA